MSFPGGITPAQFPIQDDKVLDPKLSRYCAPRHWDPTMIFRRSVPGGTQDSSLSLPMDPRPWVRVSLSYKNSGASEESVSKPKDDTVYPFGGAKYPPTRYSSAIDVESSLYRLDRQLGHGDVLEDRAAYTPDQKKIQTFYKPNPKFRLSPMTRELESPAVLGIVGANQCMTEVLSCNMQAVDRPWMHSTKLDKYKQRDGSCGETLWDYAHGKPPSSINLPTL